MSCHCAPALCPTILGRQRPAVAFARHLSKLPVLCTYTGRDGGIDEVGNMLIANVVRMAGVDPVPSDPVTWHIGTVWSVPWPPIFNGAVCLEEREEIERRWDPSS